MRTQTQTAQNESATAVSQHAAVMSLNLKLQSSAAKNQARLIEHELVKIQARESKELYEIVKVSFIKLFECDLRLIIFPPAVPSSALCRDGHGGNTVLHVLPTYGGKGRPHQLNCRAKSWITGRTQW